MPTQCIWHSGGQRFDFSYSPSTARKVEEKDKKDKVIRMERSYGSYQRSFDISGVDADKIKAKYVDGVLRLTLPKLEQRLPEGRRLEIE